MEIAISIIKWLGVFFVLMVATRFVASVLNESKPKSEHKKANYKSISQMATNLVHCKVATRKKVLTELYDDPEWTKEEVDELKGVLEGMLDTKIFLDKDNEEGTQGLKLR